MDLMEIRENKPVMPIANNHVTTYHEKKIGKNLYRVTSVYLGKVELAKALEDLTVRKILRQEYDQECAAAGSGW